MCSPASNPGPPRKVAIRFTRGPLLVVAVACAAIAAADVPEPQSAEVEHLMDYLRNSDCEMIRNGASHSAEEGARHVRRKYDHFRDEISSTEDFIAHAATRSMISGRLYQVHCPGEPPRPSGEWLLEELKRFRAADPGSGPG